MKYENLVLESDEGVATITLNRPKALNSFNHDLLGELDQAIKTIAAYKDIGVVVLTGEGRAFSAGMDLKMLAESKVADGNIGDALNALARSIIKTIESMPQAVIARINGFCFTGALEIALACDLVVVDEAALLGDTHAKVGLRPTWGMSQRLPRAVGLRKARELSFTARNFTGAEALEMGLANYAVPKDKLDAKVAELVEAILANSKGSIAAYKDLYQASQQSGLADGLAYEKETEFIIEDSAERVASFLKK
jgi:enoyl-CoA hydratase/carnithine racemase